MLGTLAQQVAVSVSACPQISTTNISISTTSTRTTKKSKNQTPSQA